MHPNENNENNSNCSDLTKAFFILIVFCLFLYVSKSLRQPPSGMVNAVFLSAEQKLLFRCASSLPPRTVSTTRDLVWTMTLNRDRLFDVTLLSIRTSGCRARIVVFTSVGHEYNPHFASVLEMSGAEVHRQQLPSGRYLNDFVRFQ
jgi:hypothetical protein